MVALRVVALVVAVVGLFLLHLHARMAELPLVKVSEINPCMNFAAVRVQGVLLEDVRRLKRGTLLYRIDDGTGVLTVLLERAPEQCWAQAGRPIEVEGTLTVDSADTVRLRVRSPDHVKLDGVTGAEVCHTVVELGDVAACRRHARIVVAGNVSEIRRPRPGSRAPHKMILSEGEDTLEVVYWAEQPGPWLRNDRLEVFGTVSRYKGRLQLKVGDLQDIQQLEVL